ncbi:uncharacterized protein LOC142334094 [Lycorma delicatula]|uniref:uncharacterized protein LOC142334094 n=1 Tax=Lycorma delicatula TaxID=130591 RepID=UPI003F51892F
MNMAAGEECDDFESWEEMEDAGVLDKKFENLKAAMSTTIQKDLRSGISSSGKPDTVVFLAEDGRTHYVPPEPTVKILKRPSVNNSHNAGGDGFIVNGDNSVKPKHPIKTLQQREMEYAEARLRILGEAQSPDERPALLEKICRIQNKMESVPELFEQQINHSTSSVTPSSTMTIINNTLTSKTNNMMTTVMMTPPPYSQHQQLQSAMAITSSSVSVNNSGGLCNSFMNNGCNSNGSNNSYVNTSGQYINNNINNQYGGGSSGYSLLCHSNQHYHHLHSNHLFNSSSPSVLSSSSSSTMGTTNLAAPVPMTYNNIMISSPISHNLAIRQPRGPDGTKGFNIRTLR